MYTKKIKIKENEFWWLGCINDGIKMPLERSSVYERDLRVNPTDNVINPVLLSSFGRVIYSEKGFLIRVKGGEIRLRGESEIVLAQGGTSLKEARLYASENFFAKEGKRGEIPPEVLFSVPQYCTWIDLMIDQTQEGVLEYAHSVAEAKLPAGILIIDDGWMKYYGNWTFDREKFPDPKAMIAQLHEMGFTVILWCCNYVSADSAEYRALAAEGLLLKEKDGSTAVRSWWNGKSAVLDMSNPAATEWFNARLRALMQEYGVDGFKFDAGDAGVFKHDDAFFARCDPNGQCEAWVKNALQYPFNELRAGFKNADTPVVQRLCDKRHAWGKENGLQSLIPNMIGAGLAGYPFCCPDMIGGGSFTDFSDTATLDEELVARWLEASALMPMMQFSFRLWKREKLSDLTRDFVRLHTEQGAYILQLAKHAAQTGEPIIRSLEYEFPHCGYEKIQDEFMLGDKYLVAPVLQKGVKEREVVFPKGKWYSSSEKKTYEQGVHTVSADFSELPYFEKVSE